MYFNRKPESLYIHIPFCVKKCSYCDFYSMPVAGNTEMVQKVLDETFLQISSYREKYCRDKKVNIETIYLGGGTPSIIHPDALYKFIDKIINLYDNYPLEFTIEANPETVTREFLGIIDSLPVTRLSLGIQSFNEKMLGILGRNCTRESIYKSLELIADFWKRKLSFDLISSIPGQSINNALADIRKAMEFRPGHISLYSLTLEKGTPLSGKYDNNDINDECWIAASDFLFSNGYNHYEISNFSVSGEECLHSMNYWRMKPYIGCGMGSVSTIYRDKTALRLTTGKVPEIFLMGAVTDWGSEKEIIDTVSLLTEILMMGFRTQEGINLSGAGMEFGIDIEDMLNPVIKKWEDMGYICRTAADKSILTSLTREGRMFHSSFIIDLMKELDKHNSRFT